MQIKSLHTYTQQEKVGKKQNLRLDKNTIPRMREGGCSLEKEFLEQVKLIFNSIWQGVFDHLFDLGVGTKMEPFQYFFFQIISSILMKIYKR